MDTAVWTLADLAGSYRLIDFTVARGGAVVTSDDVTSFSGSMIIDAVGATSTQTITLDGQTATATATGMSVSGNEITATYDSCTYSFTFDFSDEVLTTFVAEFAVCGQNWYSEEDVWRRTSRDMRSGSEVFARKAPPEPTPTGAGAGVLAGAALSGVAPSF